MDTALPSQSCTIQVELPRFKKVFFCFPLREGLMAWGIWNALAACVIGLVGIVCLANNNHYYPVEGVAVFMQCLLTLWALLDTAASVGMVFTIQKDNVRRLNFYYIYCTAKFWGYAALILLSLTMQGCCYRWYWYNLDAVRYYLLMGNPALGTIDLLLQGYLALLVRSQVLALGGAPRLSAFRLRCQLVYDQEPDAAYAPVDDDLPIAYKFPEADKLQEADKLPEKTDKSNLHSVE